MTLVEDLRELIETERVRFNAPGLAVAVIVEGEILFAEGFGVRDLASGAPVTGQTLFPIASDTKCFTAATLCALADEGVLDLDEPVRSYLPWFAMADDHATALVTTRDLLSHRTGLPRHDLVWYGDIDLELEDVVRALPHLPLSKPIRQAWQYNNLCYSTAGYLTQHLVGQPWKDVVQDRILDPLGMKSTVFEATGEGDFAMPYSEIDGELLLQVLPARSKLGPPGGMVSNVEDMARWVLARLGHEIDGARPLSEAALAQLHTPAMIGGTVATTHPERQPSGYALGCQVESYRGHRLVRHGGNLVGYSSDVCIAPQLDAAVVVLSNKHANGARDALALMILDRITGMEPVAWGERYHEQMTAAVAGAKAARENRAEKAAGRPMNLLPAELAGTYSHPAYGEVVLTASGDGVDVEFHNLGDRISLTHHDRDVWSFNVLEFQLSVPVVFQTGAEGSVISLSLPIEPMVGPIAFAKQPAAISPGLLEAIPGDYAFGPITLTVTVTDEVVTAVTPQGKVVLVPLGGNAFGSPTISTVRAEFEQDASGAVTRLVVNPMGIFDKQ